VLTRDKASRSARRVLGRELHEFLAGPVGPEVDPPSDVGPDPLGTSRKPARPRGQPARGGARKDIIVWQNRDGSAAYPPASKGRKTGPVVPDEAAGPPVGVCRRATSTTGHRAVARLSLPPGRGSVHGGGQRRFLPRFAPSLRQLGPLTPTRGRGKRAALMQQCSRHVRANTKRPPHLGPLSPAIRRGGARKGVVGTAGGRRNPGAPTVGSPGKATIRRRGHSSRA